MTDTPGRAEEETLEGRTRRERFEIDNDRWLGRGGRRQTSRHRERKWAMRKKKVDAYNINGPYVCIDRSEGVSIYSWC